jgi:hypothetical protein
MEHPTRSEQYRWVRLGTGGGIVLLLIAGACASNTFKTSEIDAFELAVRAQTKEGAFNFIDEFGTSHLVGALVESLPSDIASQVCREMSGAAARNARRSCEPLQMIAGVSAAAAPPFQTAVRASAPVQVPGALAKPLTTTPSTPAELTAAASDPTDVPDAVARDTTVPEMAAIQPAAAPAVNNQTFESKPLADNLTVRLEQIGGSATRNSETNWEIARNRDAIASAESVGKVQTAEPGTGAPLIWPPEQASGDSGPSMTSDDDSVEAPTATNAAAEAAAAKAAAAKAAAAKAAAAEAAAAKAAAAKAAKAAAARGAGAGGANNGGRHDSDSHR